jgi:hypothetical protein
VDADGAFALRSVPIPGGTAEGAFRAAAALPATPPEWTLRVDPDDRVEVRAGATTSLHLRVRREPPTRVWGVVRDDAGEPVPYAVLHVGDQPAVADAAGRFEVPATALEPFHLRCRESGFVAYGAGPLEPAPGRWLRHDVSLVRAHVLEGEVVTGDGRPVGGVLLRLLDHEGGLRGASRTDSAGRMAFPAVPRGRYRVYVDLARDLFPGPPLPDRAVEVPGAPLVLRVPEPLPSSSVRGRVDPPVDGTLTFAGPAARSAAVRAGAFEAEQVPHGSYFLRVSTGGADYFAGPFRVPGEPWSVPLGEPGEVRGAVDGPDGSALPGLVVEARHHGSGLLAL